MLHGISLVTLCGLPLTGVPITDEDAALEPHVVVLYLPSCCLGVALALVLGEYLGFFIVLICTLFYRTISMLMKSIDMNSSPSSATGRPLHGPPSSFQ